MIVSYGHALVVV